MNDSKSSLIPIEQAAAQLVLEPSTLRALIKRAKLRDPIGDDDLVYEWSLPRKPA